MPEMRESASGSHICSGEFVYPQNGVTEVLRLRLKPRATAQGLPRQVDAQSSWRTSDLPGLLPVPRLRCSTLQGDALSGTLRVDSWREQPFAPAIGRRLVANAGECARSFG